jgi:hypothetical protein
MKNALRTLIVGGLVAGSLAGSAGSVIARDYWHWSQRERRWDYRADVRSDRRDFAQARRQLEYDRAHHVSRRTIARDLDRIHAIENELREDRQAFYRR